MKQSILSQLQDGILDIPIDKPGPESEVHLLHQVGPIPMKALKRTVKLLNAVNEHVSTNTLDKVDPRFVLVHAWNRHRLGEAKRLLSEGFQKERTDLPGIHAVCTSGLPPYYLMSSGEAHDVVAARLLEKQEILVNVKSYCNAETNRLSIEGNDVYFWAAENEEWRRLYTESDGTIRILEALGVQLNLNYSRGSALAANLRRSFDLPSMMLQAMS